MATTHAQTPSPDRRGRYHVSAMDHFPSSSPSDYLPTIESGLNQTLSTDYLMQQMSPNAILNDAHLVDSSEFTTPSFDLDFLDSELGPTWQIEQQGIRPQDTVKQTEDTTTKQRAGVSPANRKELNEVEIPSLEDQERERRLGNELAKVRSWLESSTMGDEGAAGSDRPSTQRQPAHTDATAGEAWSFTTPHDTDRSGSYNSRMIDSMPISDAVIDSKATDVDMKDAGAPEAQRDGSDAGTTPPATVVAPLNDEIATSVQPQHDGQPFSEKFAETKPWIDAPEEADSARIKEQPPSSNDAICMFMRKARDIETASLTATLGSRRRSEADLDSLFSVAGTTKPSSNASRKRETGGSNRPSLFNRMVPGRTNSKKRKDDSGESNFPQVNFQQCRPDSMGNLSTLKRVVSQTRPKSPRLDTSVPNQSSRSPTSPSQLLGSPWNTAKNVVNRVRSRSDAGQNNPGIAELFARQGGPPTLRVPGSENEMSNYDTSVMSRDVSDTADDVELDDDDSPNSIFPMALKIGERPTAPTYEAFKAHVQKLNPRLDFFMVERIAQEQIKRHRRLLEFRTKHEAAVKRESCPSGDRCNVLGAGADYTLPTTSGRGNESTAAIFIVTNPNDSPTKSEASDEKSTSIPATFPDGIPLPPVKQLPAEFECPLCFQVKKFTKPSDWTKHVHEDVQPFTCTFPNCGEPKSFKRKADWVRHESERHRHLESWKCDVLECQHVCYRKDNFVQHLVREHRYPEPRVRLGRATSRGSSTANDDGDIVAHLVEKCRLESTQQPTDEPCRFCGNLCNSWKKLTVHLAKHMEQISMPILELIGHEIPQGTSDPSFAGEAARFNAMRQTNQQQMANGVQSMSHSQLPQVSVTNTTGSTYPPQNLARGRAVTDTRIANTAYSPQAAAAFMNQNPSSNMSNNSDYSFAYQSSRSFGSHTGQYSPYAFPNQFGQGTGQMQHKSASMSSGQFMNQNTSAADVSSFPNAWSGATHMQNNQSQLGTNYGWQEPHLSASPVEAPLHQMSQSEFAAQTGYGAGAFPQQNTHHQVPQSQDMKSNVDNTWTFDANRDPNQTFMQASGGVDGTNNATYPSHNNQNFAAQQQRMINNQTNFKDWTSGQRFGDFYGNP